MTLPDPNYDDSLAAQQRRALPGLGRLSMSRSKGGAGLGLRLRAGVRAAAFRPARNPNLNPNPSPSGLGVEIAAAGGPLVLSMNRSAEHCSAGAGERPKAEQYSALRSGSWPVGRSGRNWELPMNLVAADVRRLMLKPEKSEPPWVGCHGSGSRADVPADEGRPRRGHHHPEALWPGACGKQIKFTRAGSGLTLPASAA